MQNVKRDHLKRSVHIKSIKRESTNIQNVKRDLYIGRMSKETTQRDRHISSQTDENLQTFRMSKEGYIYEVRLTKNKKKKSIFRIPDDENAYQKRRDIHICISHVTGWRRLIGSLICIGHFPQK